MEQGKIAIEVIQQTNPVWALLLVIIPVLLTFFLRRKKALPKKGKKK